MFVTEIINKSMKLYLFSSPQKRDRPDIAPVHRTIKEAKHLQHGLLIPICDSSECSEVYILYRELELLQKRLTNYAKQSLPRIKILKLLKMKLLLCSAHLKSSKRSICRRSLKKWLDTLSCTLLFDPSDSISCEFSPPLPPNLSLKWYEARAFTAARHLSTTSLSCNKQKESELYRTKEYKFALQC